jgi:hypothetical protein
LQAEATGVASLSPIRNTEEASCRRRKKPPNLTHCTVSFRAIESLLSGVHVMNVVEEILTKLFAIGIAGAGAFVATTYILSNNWL